MTYRDTSACRRGSSVENIDTSALASSIMYGCYACDTQPTPPAPAHAATVNRNNWVVVVVVVAVCLYTVLTDPRMRCRMNEHTHTHTDHQMRLTLRLLVCRNRASRCRFTPHRHHRQVETLLLANPHRARGRSSRRSTSSSSTLALQVF